MVQKDEQSQVILDAGQCGGPLVTLHSGEYWCVGCRPKACSSDLNTDWTISIPCRVHEAVAWLLTCTSCSMNRPSVRGSHTIRTEVPSFSLQHRCKTVCLDVNIGDQADMLCIITNLYKFKVSEARHCWDCFNLQQENLYMHEF